MSETPEKYESPTVFAKRIGVTRALAAHSSYSVLSWDNVLDLASLTYWERRNVNAA